MVRVECHHEREATHDVVGKFFEHGLTFILSQRAHIQGVTEEQKALTTAAVNLTI